MKPTKRITQAELQTRYASLAPKPMRSFSERQEHWREEVGKIWDRGEVVGEDWEEMEKDDIEESEESEDTTCDSCGATLTLGSYPYCTGNPEDHATRRSRWAAQVKTIIYVGTGGQVYFPTSADDVPHGNYERHELTSLQQVDALSTRIGMHEKDKYLASQELEKLQFDAAMKRNMKELREGFFTEDADGRRVYIEPLHHQPQYVQDAVRQAYEREKDFAINRNYEPRTVLKAAHWDNVK